MKENHCKKQNKRVWAESGIKANYFATLTVRKIQGFYRMGSCIISDRYEE